MHEPLYMLLSFSHIKKVCLIIFFIPGLLNNSSAQADQVFEAEAAVLTGTAIIANCSNASGGQMIKDISNGVANAVLFKDISVPQAGDYFITVSYYATNQRKMAYQMNDKVANTFSVPASGVWCYQGGVPGDYTFQESFGEGVNELIFYDSPIIDKIVISSDTAARQSSAFYISSTTGNDDFNGFSPAMAWRTLEKVNALSLVPGDSLFFKAGDTFVGKLEIVNEGGLPDKPILIESYGDGSKPVFDGDGYLSVIHVVNSGHLLFSNLEIMNNGGQPQAGNPDKLRYGLYIENTLSEGTILEHYRLSGLTFINIYPTIEVTDDDKTGVNAHAIITNNSGSNDDHPTRFGDMLIENCLFTRTARHATVFKAVNNLVIRNNLFDHVGGAGMVIGSRCTNILVEGSTTNHTGSKIDSRMAGRGSGIWCYRSTNLTVQHNKFMHAKGIKDSYGMHIDIGNRNVVYQYNYSEGNEGGFVEILGANVNVGYRYNLSVGDGWRNRGTQPGKIFWISGWSGDAANPVGSDSIFIYNNSIYVRDTIEPVIRIVSVTKNTRIYNNIIHVSNGFGAVLIENDAGFNDFDHNIWFGNIPVTDEDGELYRGPNAMVSDPMYQFEIVTDSSGFILQPGSPALGSGKLISKAEINHPYDYFLNNGGRDYFGNAVPSSVQSNIGAYNGGGVEVSTYAGLNAGLPVNIYPNPVLEHEPLIIEIQSHVNVQDLTIQVVDISGKIRLEQKFQQQHKINLMTDQLTQGIYLIKIRAGNFIGTKHLLVF